MGNREHINVSALIRGDACLEEQIAAVEEIRALRNELDLEREWLRAAKVIIRDLIGRRWITREARGRAERFLAKCSRID